MPYRKRYQKLWRCEWEGCDYKGKPMMNVLKHEWERHMMMKAGIMIDIAKSLVKELKNKSSLYQIIGRR